MLILTTEHEKPKLSTPRHLPKIPHGPQPLGKLYGTFLRDLVLKDGEVELFWQM